MSQVLPQIAAIIVAVFMGGAANALINYVSNRKKMGADAVKVYTETSLILLTPMKEEITRLEGRVRTMTDQMMIASALLRQHNIEWPVGATPPPWL